jgi:dimethylargininase
MTLVAITRPVSSSLAQCEITFIERESIDLSLARHQHAAYEATLERLGARLVRLPRADAYPDAVFIEDTALVLDRLAVIPIMGAPSRRGETAEVAGCLAAYRPLHQLEAPATLDGGDVMQADRTLYVGLTARTNRAAVEQLASATEAHGYRLVPIVPTGCLHLKSACTYLGRGVVLANPDWIDPACLHGLDVIPVAPEEPFAANALAIAGRLVYASDFPKTRATLERRGFEVTTLDTAELRKAESAMTCMSLVFEA